MFFLNIKTFLSIDDVDILDIGCGNGASTEQILEKCSPSVIDALDPSEDQIKFAKSRKLTKLANFSTVSAVADV